jgi:hypothetical protein
MLQEFTAWLLGLVKEAFKALWDFIADAVINLLDLFVGALVSLVSAIPVPGFMADGLQAVYGSLDPSIGYLLAATGLPAGLAIIGTGYAFRLARKVATLFQW